MTDTKTSGDKTLHVSPKTLTLKRPVEQNMVRQSFSHGRSKAVVVETVKRRPAPAAPTLPLPRGDAPSAKAAPAPAGAPATARAAQPAAPQSRPTGVVLRTLSDQERDARLNALTDARRREEEDRTRQAEEAQRRAERDERDARSVKPPRRASARRTSAAAIEDERKRRAEDEARRRLGEEPSRAAAARRPFVRLFAPPTEPQPYGTAGSHSACEPDSRGDGRASGERRHAAPSRSGRPRAGRGGR